nr:gustatory receptor 50 [Papilio glaucus]
MIYDKFNNMSLSQNYVQLFIQKVLFPLNLMQYINLCPKYCIRHNFINPNSIATNVMIFSTTAIIFLYYLYLSFEVLIQLKSVLTSYMYFLYSFLYLINGFGYLFNAILMVLKSHIHVALIIRMGMIQSKLKMNKRDKLRIVIGNWVFCFLIILFYSIICGVQFFYGFSNYMLILLSFLIVMPWDLNIIYAARMAYLLRKQTDSWISNLNDMLNARNFIEGNEAKGNLRWQTILNAYLCIIEGYSICEKVTEIPIIYHVIITFIQFIINIQTLISVSISQNVNIVLVLCVLWTIKNAILMVSVCRECEKVYSSLKNSQIVCLNTVYKDSSDFGRQICKRLRKQAKRQLQPLCAKGWLTVDLTLPLHLFSIVATYTVVLLQFNFL